MNGHEEGREKKQMETKRRTQEKEKRGGLEEHTHGQGEREKKTD